MWTIETYVVLETVDKKPVDIGVIDEHPIRQVVAVPDRSGNGAL